MKILLICNETTQIKHKPYSAPLSGNPSFLVNYITETCHNKFICIKSNIVNDSATFVEKKTKPFFIKSCSPHYHHLLQSIQETFNLKAAPIYVYV